MKDKEVELLAAQILCHMNMQFDKEEECDLPIDVEKISKEHNGKITPLVTAFVFAACSMMSKFMNKDIDFLEAISLMNRVGFLALLKDHGSE